MAGQVVSAELRSGETVLLRRGDDMGALAVEGLPSTEDVIDAIEKFGKELRDAARVVSPDKASIEFGLELEVAEGKLIGLLAKAKGTASVTVKLEWDFSQESNDAGLHSEKSARP